MSRPPRPGFVALALVVPIVLPAVTYVVVGLMDGLGVGGAVSALVAQIGDGRPNPLIAGILGLLPMGLLLLGVWVGGRLHAAGHRVVAAGWGGFGAILLVLVWVNLMAWPLYLPGRSFPGFPHGLELVIGPIFFAPVAMVVGAGIGWVVAGRGRPAALTLLGLAFAGGATALISGIVPRASAEPPAPTPVSVCRCPQEALATYYDRADEVLLARLARALDGDGDRVLEMVVAEIPWRISATRPATLLTGDSITYRTGVTTAECGVPVEIGAVYVVFAHAPAEPGTPLGVDTCSGTRIYITSAGGDPQGFDDVPGPRVIAQLDALSGLDDLKDVAANYPAGDDPDNETLIGLLDLPALGAGGTIPIREWPDAAAPETGQVDSYDGVESREAGYEEPAAVVFARVDGWYRVRLSDGRYGWIGSNDAGTWSPFAELPVNRLAYLTEAWSGHVWPEPGAGIPARSGRRATQERREYAVEVHESQRVGGTIWFRVDVLSGSPCEGGEARPELSGWVPGYGANGQPAAWYYSRGC